MPAEVIRLPLRRRTSSVWMFESGESCERFVKLLYSSVRDLSVVMNNGAVSVERAFEDASSLVKLGKYETIVHISSHARRVSSSSKSVMPISFSRACIEFGTEMSANRLPLYLSQ